MTVLNYKEGFIRVSIVCCALYFLIAMFLLVQDTIKTYKKVQLMEPRPTSQADFFWHANSVCNSAPALSCHELCSSISKLQDPLISLLQGTWHKKDENEKTRLEDQQYYKEREDAWKNCLTQRYKIGYRQMIADTIKAFVWIVSAPVWLFLGVTILIKLRHSMKTTSLKIYGIISKPLRWIIEGFKDSTRG